MSSKAGSKSTIRSRGTTLACISSISDPIRAQEILQYYLDDFRELQRQEAIRNASAAIQSLEKEAGSTGDSLLRENLYALAARQVERQKLAEVEADFAFKVLEQPVSPDRPYSPTREYQLLL